MDRIIRCKRREAGKWLYIKADGGLSSDPSLAERIDGNEAGRRILHYLNDYPGWQFEEVGHNAA